MAITNLKKVVVVALLGAVLFLASFVISNRINAYDIFCDPTAIWYDAFGVEQCGPVGGVPAAPAVSGEMWMASYYDYSHAGNLTASGMPFNPSGLTAAHKTLPFGTQLLVSYGGRSAQVTVNDRGPFVAGRDIDLSQAAADVIGLTGAGVAPVQVTVL